MVDSDRQTDERGSQNLKKKGEKRKNNFIERWRFFLK